MLQPTTVEFNGVTYHLGKFPATVGREIITQYPTSAMPKIGDYKTNAALMVRIMSYVGVEVEGRDGHLMLSTEALINNHVANAETLLKLEWAMISHNFDFFTNGQASGFLESLAGRVQGLITKTLMDFSGR